MIEVKLSRKRRAWHALLSVGSILVAFSCAQDAAGWAADGRWFWPLGVAGAIGWLFWSYEDADRATTGMRKFR